MYPTFSDLLKDIFGIYIPLPIQTYGFFLAIALLVAAYVFYLEFKRKTQENKLLPFYVKKVIGEPPTFSFVFWNLVLSFFVFYKLVYLILNYSKFVENPQREIISPDGNFLGGLILSIIYTAYYYYKKNKQKLPQPKVEYKQQQPYDIVSNLFFIVALAGILGAKIFDVIQPQNIENFLQNPLEMLLSFSGLTYYGGIIGGFVVGVWYIRKYNINLIHSLDALAPAAAIGYGLGRIGCHTSGDGCWGIPNTLPKPQWLSFIPDWAWSYDYPNNVLHIKLLEPVYPTSFYETVMMLVIFIILWSLRKKIKIPGLIFTIYLYLSAIERFVIEFIRNTHRYNIFGVKISQAQIISVILFGIALYLTYLIVYKRQLIEKWATTTPKAINNPQNIRK